MIPELLACRMSLARWINRAPLLSYLASAAAGGASGGASGADCRGDGGVSRLVLLVLELRMVSDWLPTPLVLLASLPSP